MALRKLAYIYLTIIIFLLPATIHAAEDSLHIPDSILPSAPTLNLGAAPSIPDKLPGYQKTDEERWWWNQVKSMKLNINDTTVRYPKFLKFCLDVYHWADHFFNYYEPEYVVGTGKRWKARIVSDNWADSHAMTFPKDMKMAMLSRVYANIGAYVQYMAVSAGYTFDVSNIAHTKMMDHAKMEFGFNCALFDIELYYHENTGGTYLRRFGDYLDGKFFKERFPGVSFYTFGIDATYFFNHKRYSQGAAYNFSKFQKRSQGSWIIGFSYVNNNIMFDFRELPLDLLPYLTIPVSTYHFHYRSYAIIGGFGYNWVVNKRLLFNGTLIPSLGLTHCYEDSLEGEKYMLSRNLAGKASVTYNLGNFFFSGIFRFNGNWYRSNTYSLFSSILNFSGNVGFRF